MNGAVLKLVVDNTHHKSQAVSFLLKQHSIFDGKAEVVRTKPNVGLLNYKEIFRMRKNIAEITVLRRIMFPILKRLNFEYGWKHDITLRKLYLETWPHKGYWYYGSQRESSEVKMFSKLINKGDCKMSQSYS
jgi:hypothetical protein